MVGKTLIFLRDHLNDLLTVENSGSLDQASAPRVVFLDGANDGLEATNFTLGAVTLMLINLEEERLMRDPEPYRRIDGNGNAQCVSPDIRLVLYTLFVARYKDYASSWDNLSRILRHFQSVPVFDKESIVNLPDGVERLVFELATQSFNEQNDIWSILRTSHHPSLLYRVKLLTIRDLLATPIQMIPEVESSLRAQRLGEQR